MSKLDGTTEMPPVDEAVGLLARNAPVKLAALSAELLQTFPSQGNELRLLLEPGETAGLSDPLILPRARLCIVALEEAQALCERRITTARTRLQAANRWRMIGEIVAALGSISVLGTLAAKWGLGAVFSGIIALIGSFSSLGAKWAVETIDTTNGTMSERYTKLIAGREDAKRLRDELGLQVDNFGEHTDDAILGKLIGDANALCRAINIVDV